MTTFRIAVIGGTGPQGKGLAYRFAKHGNEVVIGSRAADKAEVTAKEIAERITAEGGAPVVSGAANADAVSAADVVLLAIPFNGHDELVESLAAELAGKTIISCVNPLGFDKGGPYGLDVERSAAEAAAAIVPTASVVGAFHHVAAASLWSEDEYLDHEDVLVCGDSAESKETAQELARTVTSRIGIDAGKLRLARQLEPLTAVLISINKKYKVRSGISISGL
ncbi:MULTISPECIES: NADPH-dependent F420 reductase [unclassified Nocardioides]|uniref:NADPH-dependent F420 reductase n=1 Tax=unclassified Nocardioides TaxID=2615069 RepID=UPI000700EFD3|nr:MULTISPECIES: NADPH-dependent F420 reductase [unclassified Nocardioides]KQY56541.1 oxidoreductase [Nocardioides sp. Root140]KQZ75295.1 oxidoreductase [Nocardioides sp. Root151]KRF14376.1 oxidoreductase [Nocardioides sp. Soil796]